MLVKAGLTLLSSVIGLVGDRGKATAENLTARRDAMERTWTDEFIVLYWFAPTVVAWFGVNSALLAQQAAIADGGPLFQVQVLLTAAVFGLGKMKIKK